MFAARPTAIGWQQNTDNRHRAGFGFRGFFPVTFFSPYDFFSPRDVPYGDLVEEALLPKVSPHGKSHRTNLSSRHSFAVGSFAESSLAV